VSLTEADVATFERCIAVGGVALFPADTVYGLATEPDSREGIERLYRLKGRRPDRPAAVMFFDTERALEALPELPQATKAAAKRLLPGGVTLLVPNKAHRYPLACEPNQDVLGLRVPSLSNDVAPLQHMRWPILQSSANRSGEPDAKRIEDVDSNIRAGVDLILDAGELPGTPSTVVDLTGFEENGRFRIVREGAVSAEQIRDALG
jgi:L-threonylcarbamoyladenylate synthase